MNLVDSMVENMRDNLEACTCYYPVNALNMPTRHEMALTGTK